MHKIRATITAGALFLAVVSASAGEILLDFENISPTYPFSNVAILNYYNGGVSAVGTSGTNYGIAFDNNAEAFCLNTLDIWCTNTSRGGLAPSSATAGFGLVEDGETIIDVAGGFIGNFSFAYSQPLVEFGDLGVVDIYGGTGGTGSLLATFALKLTQSDCASGYLAEWCPFVETSVPFSGTAYSVVITGTSDYLVFDDLRFGLPSDGDDGGGVTSGVPEPATWAMLLLGFGLIGTVACRYDRKAVCEER